MSSARWLLGMAALVWGATALPQTASVRATVAPERGAGRVLTGRYVLSLEVVKAPEARLVTSRLRVPIAYDVPTAARGIRVEAVRPGAEVLRMDLNTPPTAPVGDDTPLLFADASTGSDFIFLDVVALLKASHAAPKHVCDVVFTATGRPTTKPIIFYPDSVAISNADSAVLGNTGFFATAAVPLFGDLDWSGAVNALDLSLFAEAWRTSDTTGTALPLADLHPYSGGTDPAKMVSRGNKLIDNRDLAALKTAWTAYNNTVAAAGDVSRKGNDR